MLSFVTLAFYTDGSAFCIGIKSFYLGTYDIMRFPLHVVSRVRPQIFVVLSEKAKMGETYYYISGISKTYKQHTEKPSPVLGR